MPPPQSPADAPGDDLNPYAPPTAHDEPAPARRSPAAPPGGLAVTYQNNEEDFAAYARYFVRRFTRQRQVLVLVFVLVAGLLGYNAYHEYRAHAPVPSNALLLAGWVTFMLFNLVTGHRKLTKAMMKARPTIPEVTMAITADGLVARGDTGGVVRQSWAAIPSVEATSTHLFLFELQDRGRAVSAHVIPRSAFASPADAELFLETARRWLAESRDRPAAQAPAAAQESGDGTAVTFVLTDAERRRAHRFYLAQYPRVRWVLLGLTLLFGGAMAFNMGLMVMLWQRSRAPVPAGFYAMFLLPALLLMFVLAQWRRRRYRPPAAGSAEVRPVTVRIGPEGYTAERDGRVEMAKSWRSLPGLAADDTFLILPKVMIADGRRVLDAWMIPRRAFDSPATAEAFLRAARQWHAAAHGGRVHDRA